MRFNKKIVKIGNSHYILIPDFIMTTKNIKTNDTIRIDVLHKVKTNGHSR